MPFLTLAADSLDPAVLPAVSMVSSLGFAVWYAWYVTTVAIPKLLDSHKQEREEMQKRFDQVLLDLRTEFNTDLHALMVEIKEQRTQFTSLMTRTSSP